MNKSVTVSGIASDVTKYGHASAMVSRILFRLDNRLVSYTGSGDLNSGDRVAISGVVKSTGEIDAYALLNEATNTIHPSYYLLANKIAGVIIFGTYFLLALAFSGFGLDGGILGVLGAFALALVILSPVGFLSFFFFRKKKRYVTAIEELKR